MKSWKIAAVALAVLMQLAWPHNVGVFGVVPNFLLILLVLLSVNTDAVALLWSALLGGFLLDMASARDFGFHMAFYIFVVLVVKLVLRLGESTLRLSVLTLITALATIGYNALLLTPVMKAEYLVHTQAFLSRIGVEVLYNCCIVAAVGATVRLRQRGIISA